MPAYKALFMLIIVGAIVALGVFTFIPSLRPAFVEAWFQKASGFTPAQSPDEALDKFRNAMKARDFEAAKLYCTGDYLEQIKIAAEPARELAKALDAFSYTFKETKKLKSDKVEYALRLLDPFPPVFEVRDVKKDGNKATALIEFKYANTVNPGYMANWGYDQRINNALVPAWPLISVGLKKEGTGKDEAWKIEFPPLTPQLRD